MVADVHASLTWNSPTETPAERTCYTTSPRGQGRGHVRSQTGHQVSAGAAAQVMVDRLASEAEERRQIVLAAHVIGEDGDVLRALTKR